jgi:UDP-2,4-diacetamido-2,4,6-trideoxy-beta-L-altropyranose hydrolase
MTLHVAFRVDGSSQMGSGHVIRCLTLAGELRRRGASVTFISREHTGNLIATIEQAGYEAHRLPAPSAGSVTADQRTWLGVPSETDARQSLAALAAHEPDWLVVDHYCIDASWQQQVRGVRSKVLVIDDLANRQHAADIVLDQSLPGSHDRYAMRVAADCRRLLGPRYALLQPLYAQLRRVLPERDGTIRRVLLFFGAHDPSRSALRVLRVLCEPEFAQLAVDVVPGNDAQLTSELRALMGARAGGAIHENLPGLAALLVRADLAIGAGGSNSWERACCGLPAIVATIADNQAASAEALAQDGSISLAGVATSLSDEDWRQALRGLVQSPQRALAIGRRAQRLVDGHGAARVAVAMTGGRALRMSLRPATVRDESLLLDWANDHAVRMHAFDQQTISAEQHHAWLTRRLGNAACTILIGEDEHGLPLGQVRFERNGDSEATIDISVEPVVRGEGVGRRLLVAALARWRDRHPGVTAVAEVLDGNEASQALFRSSGFVEVAARRPDTHTFIHAAKAST